MSRFFVVAAAGAVTALVVLAPAAAAEAGAAEAAAPEAVVTLPIPARSHAPEAPKEGWCGETAIQEGLLHVGVWAPQRLINRAGKPTHPDLYSPDLPVALTELGVRYSVYGGSVGFEAYSKWVRKALDEGDPVVAGVKILPTQHPEWGLDHFVLVVGHGSGGLLVNTTWGSRRWVGDTTTPGLSLRNAFYGLRLSGQTLAGSGARPARLSVLEESAASVKLRVRCDGLKPGTKVRMERRTARAEERASWSEDFAATSGGVEKEVTVDAGASARFQCVAL